MNVKIIENHSERAVNLKRIVERIMNYLQPSIYEGLKEIILFDNHEEDRAFAKYDKSLSRIELYIEPLLSDIPWILKRTYIFPYLIIGMALGHELDHHVNRNNTLADQEQSAESNSLKYVYPSLGIFKPLFKLFAFLLRKKQSLANQSLQ